MFEDLLDSVGAASDDDVARTVADDAADSELWTTEKFNPADYDIMFCIQITRKIRIDIELQEEIVSKVSEALDAMLSSSRIVDDYSKFFIAGGQYSQFDLLGRDIGQRGLLIFVGVTFTRTDYFQALKFMENIYNLTQRKYVDLIILDFCLFVYNQASVLIKSITGGRNILKSEIEMLKSRKLSTINTLYRCCNVICANQDDINAFGEMLDSYKTR